MHWPGFETELSGGKERLGGVGQPLSGLDSHDRAIVRHQTRQAIGLYQPTLVGSYAGKTTNADCGANKIARMAWAMMVRGEPYREPIALAA